MGTPKSRPTQRDAPPRPFEDSGTLVQPRRTPRRSSAILAACERPLLAHLKAVCSWPERERDRSWHIGDYSYYVLEFSPAPGAEVYAQFWSEPDEDGLIVATRDHAGDVRQSIAAGAAGAVGDARALARHAVAILCKELGYDGRVPLTYRLHLGTRLKPDLVFDAISASDLAKLMRRWGYTARVDEQDGKPRFITSAVGAQPFLVAFVGERPKGSNEYGMVELRSFFRFEGEVPGNLLHMINHDSIALRASVDEEGDLLVQTPILLHGGISVANLEMSFGIWKQTIDEIVKGLA